MAEGRSDDFKKHFCGSHFFNPPRYLKLLEIIPTKETLAASVVDFLMDYGSKVPWQNHRVAKDTPAFIGNRIGMFSIMSVLHYVEKTGMTVEEVDKLTGPVIGHPKSATFRTNDVVGLDTMVHVANGLYQNAPDDEARELFKVPEFVDGMVKNNWLGSKTGQGFYKKEKVDGVNQFYALDLKTLEYKPSQKVKFASLETTKAVDSLPG
jgi:3-hydroxyacyl-CoA dehydrogenase